METIGILVHGNNHFIVAGPRPEHQTALALVRQWSVIQIGGAPPIPGWEIRTKAFRENLSWAAIVPENPWVPCYRENSEAVTTLLAELSARGVAIDTWPLARHEPVTSAVVRGIALECGFDLAGIAAAAPLPEADHYLDWTRRGMAGKMGYLTDHRAGLRRDPRLLLPSARSVLVVGQLYNAPVPYSDQFDDDALAWISRYAWGEDYHDVMRTRLEEVDRRLRALAPCETKICVDTAPLLERPLARAAGLGWIAKNTCLIHQGKGSWFFLGELLTSLELEPGTPPPDRCGSCSRCIDACPTSAIVPTGHDSPAWELDARLCISYLNIELKGEIPEEQRSGQGRHVFGCDICQDVCPWNSRAPITQQEPWQPRSVAPPLADLAALTPEDFRALFRGTPVERTRYQGFLRNVAVAMGNSGRPDFRVPLQKLAADTDPVIASHASWALTQLQLNAECA